MEKKQDKNINQIYIGSIPKSKKFSTKHTFECGQCFRWNKEKIEDEKETYIGVVNGRIFEIIEGKEPGTYEIYSNVQPGEAEENIKEITKKEIFQYLDLYFDYSKAQKEVLNKNLSFKNELDEAIQFGYGIKILNQDFFETLCSFIISANNNIPRIKKSVELIAKKYGKEIEYKNKIYYSFPTPEMLAKATEEELRETGIGYRAKYLVNTVKSVLNNDSLKEMLINIKENKINLITSEKEIKEELMKLQGVGPKVAECIMLFSLGMKQSFPIDVWVNRVVNELYFHKEDEKKIKRKEVEKFAKDSFGEYAGLMQQYLFYWRRERL